MGIEQWAGQVKSPTLEVHLVKETNEINVRYVVYETISIFRSKKKSKERESVGFV